MITYLWIVLFFAKPDTYNAETMTGCKNGAMQRRYHQQSVWGLPAISTAPVDMNYLVETYPCMDARQFKVQSYEIIESSVEVKGK